MPLTNEAKRKKKEREAAQGGKLTSRSTSTKAKTSSWDRDRSAISRASIGPEVDTGLKEPKLTGNWDKDQETLRVWQIKSHARAQINYKKQMGGAKLNDMRDTTVDKLRQSLGMKSKDTAAGRAATRAADEAAAARQMAAAGLATQNDKLYQEGYLAYVEAMGRAEQVWKAEDTARSIGRAGTDALSRLLPGDRSGRQLSTAADRLARDEGRYTRMAEAASRIGSQEGAQMAVTGINSDIERYNRALAQYDQDRAERMDRLKETSPSDYLAQTVSRRDLERSYRGAREMEWAARQARDQARAENPDYRPSYQGGTIVGRETQEEDLALQQAMEVTSRFGSALRIRDQEDRRNRFAAMEAQTRGSSDFAARAAEGKRRYEQEQETAYQQTRANAQGLLPELPEDQWPMHGSDIPGYRTQAAERNTDLDNNWMSDRDREVYYALYAQDPQQAREWAQWASEQGHARYIQAMEDWAGQNPGTRALAFLGGTATNILAGISNLAEPFSDTALEISRTGQGLISGGAKGLTEKGLFNTGLLSGTIDEDTPIVGHILGGKGLGDLYTLASSVAQSTATAALAGHAGSMGKIVENLGLAIMGSSAAATDYDECLSRGLNESQAMQHAFAAGINEALFEKLSLENLIHPSETAGALRRWFTQSGIEASEEFFTTVANTLADGVLARGNGYDNQIEYRMRELMALGQSFDEAKKKAQDEWITDLVNDAIGGFISGGMSDIAMLPARAAMRTAGNVAEISNAAQQAHGTPQNVNLNQRALRPYMEQTGAEVSGTEAEALVRYAEDEGLQVSQGAKDAAKRLTEADENRNAPHPSASQTPSPQGEGLDTGDTDSSATLRAPQTPEQSAGVQSNDNEGKVRRKEARAQQRSYRELGVVGETVTRSIREKVDQRGLGSLQEVYDETVEKYGEGVKRFAQEAVRRAAAQAMGEATTVADLNQWAEALTRNASQEVKAAVEQAKGPMELRLTVQDRAQKRSQPLDLKVSVKGREDSGSEIRGFASDGKVVLANGETVAADRIEGDADTLDVVQTISTLGMSGDAANRMFESYQQAVSSGETRGYQWVMDYATAYDRGRVGSFDLRKAQANSRLDAATVKEAYELGQKAKKGRTGKGLAVVEAAERRSLVQGREATSSAPLRGAPSPQGEGIGATGRRGTVDRSAIAGLTLSEDQSAQLELVEKIASAFGIDVGAFASGTKQVEIGGVTKEMYQGENGRYQDGKIWIDINAGRNFVEDVGSGILATMGHELTHWIQEYAPEEYEALQDFIVQRIVEARGERYLNRLIQDKINRARDNLSREEALDEVVADACQEILSDSKAVQKLANENPTLLQKVLDWLHDFVDKVREALGSTPRLSEEARIMRDLEARLRKTFGELWDKGIVKAAEVHDRVGSMEREKNTAREGGEQFSEREIVDKNGHSYGMGVYMDSTLFAGLTESERVDMFRMYLDEVSGESFDAVDKNNDPVKVNIAEKGRRFTEHNGKRPLVNDDLKQKHRKNHTKQEAIALIDEVLHTARYKDEGPAKHSHGWLDNNGTNPWQGWRTYMQDPNGTIYETILHITTSDSGEFFLYDITPKKIKEVGQSGNSDTDPNLSGGQSGNSDTSPSNDKIAQTEEKVKTDGKKSDRDTTYLELAKDPQKNQAKLQEMVDEAARESGARTIGGRKVMKYYHGTGRRFTKFEANKSKRGTYGYGFYFTPVQSFAENYGHPLSVYIMTNNFATHDDNKITENQVREIVEKYNIPLSDYVYRPIGDIKTWVESHDDLTIILELQRYIDSVSKKRAAGILKDFHRVFGYDGVRQARETVLWDNTLAKSADPVTYDDAGNVIPLSERFNTKNQDIRYSDRDVAAVERENVALDLKTESAAPMDGPLYSERTWTASRFVQDRENAAKALAKALGVTEKKAKKYIDDINSVAKEIADHRARLDYMSSPGRSAFKSNAEYGGSIDFSTLCKKRQLLTGTFNAIQHALANTVLTAEDVLRVRQMMQDAGLEVNCGMCYVEGSRARMGEYNKTFLELYRRYFPDNWQPRMEDVNTTDGLELMRMEHPEAYEQYEYFYNNHGTLRSGDKAIFSSQAKPKEYQLRTEYNGEIRDKFQKESNVEAKNRNGGLRMQSFSDFEIVHLIDCMQVIMDMSEVGLAGQAYTKVPEFAEALGKTGLKINLSLVAKGVDSNGKLIYNDVEGMPHERAFGIRDNYSENVGTIIVVYDDAQLIAAMAEDKVDFIIPFHRSQWRKSQYAAMGLPSTTKDYTYQQNEKWLNPKAHTHEYRGRTVPTKATNYMPNEYWDFSLSGKENAERYLEMCARDGKRPKFYKLLQNNGDGTFSLKADGSTDGYWKLLIDFKMYDNNGVGVPQQPVRPIFDMDNAMRMLDEYSGDPSRFPVAQGIVDEFVSQYKKDHPRAQYSMRDYDNTLSDYDLIMGSDGEGLVGDQKTQLKETKERISRVQKLRGQLAQERVNAQGWERVADLSSKQLDKMIKEKRKLERQLEQQIQREEAIITGKLKPLAMQRLLKAEREKAESKVKKHKDEVFQSYKNRRRDTALRGRIRNLANELRRSMTNPTDRNYLPAHLAEHMTALLDSLDRIDEPRPGTQAADKHKATAEALRRLAETYNDISGEDVDPMFRTEYDDELWQSIKDLAKVFEAKEAERGTAAGSLNGDKPGLRDLSSEELEQVYDLVKTIRDQMRQATKLLNTARWKSVQEAIQSVAAQQQSMTPFADVKPHEQKKRLRMLDNMSVMRAVEMMSGWDRNAALYQLMQGVEQGTVEAGTWVMEYNKAMQALKTGRNEKAYRQALTKAEDYGATDKTSGRAVKMTKLQAIQLLMTWQREANNDKLVHLQKGGATIRDAVAIQDGKGSKATSHTVRVTPELISTIEGRLTEWDRAYMKAVRDYLNKEARETNKVLYQLKHRVLSTEDYYVPYIVDKGYLETKLEGSDVFNLFVKTPGSTQALQKRAPQPVIIDGMDTMMKKHVQDTANYVGLAIPIRDFAKVYNGRLAATEAGEVYTSVQKTIQENFQEKGTGLILQALLDVQGSTKGNSWNSQIAETLNKMQSMWVRTALMVNPSVTIKQAASYIAAESVLSHRALERGNHPIAATTDKSKAFAPGGLIRHLFFNPEGRTAQRIYNEIDQHTSMHYERRLGMSQAELADQALRSSPLRRRMNAIGASMEQSRAGHAARKAGEALNPYSWIQRMDVATTAALWVACKEQARMDGMTAESQEYWQRTTELYERALRETQPMYDSLHRTANQKQHGGIMTYLFPFRTVPIQNHGQVAASYEALLASKNKSKAEQAKAGKFFVKTVWAQTESAFIFSLMTFLAAAMKRKTKKYRDEDEELTPWSLAKGFGADVASTWFSVLFPVFGSEMWNIGNRIYDKIEGSSGYTYDAFSVGVVDMLNDLASAGDKLWVDVGKLHRGEPVNIKDIESHGLTLLLKGAKLAGIPADTVKTYAVGTWGNVRDLLEGRVPALNDESWERSAATNAGRYLKAWIAGDLRKVDQVEAEMLRTYTDGGKSEEDAGEALKSKLTSTAKDALLDGTLDEQDAIDFLVETGYYSEDDAWKKVQEWQSKAEHADEEDFSYSQYLEFFEDLDSGMSFADAAADYLTHGYKEEDLRSNAVKHAKKRYQAGDLTEDEAIDLLLDYAWKKDGGKYRNLTEDEAWLTIQKWDALAEHEEDPEYNYSMYDELHQAISANQDASKIIKGLTDHGVKEENVVKDVKAYLQELYVEGNLTETAYKNYLSRYAKIVKTDEVTGILNNAKCKKETGYTMDGLKEGYQEGGVSTEKVTQMLTKYKGMTASEAKARVRYWDYIGKNPDGALSEANLNTWYDTKVNGKTLQEWKVPLETWESYKDQGRSVTGTDANGDGKTDPGSKKKEMLKLIDRLSLSNEQKDALYYYEGWAASTIWEAPWH